MKRDSNVIIRINSDLKRDVLKLMKENEVSLSDVLNIYITDMVHRKKIPAVIKARAKAYSPKKEEMLDIFKIRYLLNEAINEWGSEKIKKVYLFGSFARNEQTNKSDVDLRFETTGDYSMKDTGNLRYLLKEKFKRDVDIVTEDFDKLDPWFAEQLRKEEICIYG